VKQPSVALDRRDEFAERERRIAEVVAGLNERPMRLSPLWFYDERGSALFEQICGLPEYYLTRTELRIMQQHVAAMADALGPRVALIEPGSGASRKTRLLLEALERPAAYLPVDISREHLYAAARSLRRDYPGLSVQPLAADFTRPLRLPAGLAASSRRRVVYFPGSTLGNFRRDEAVSLLSRFRNLAGDDGALLLGVDRVKAPDVLERAYDDAAGVTAEFNLNALRHLNRELDAGFDLAGFRHRAPWIAERGRIEMHLVALRPQRFSLGDECFELDQGDYLLTEYSHKYSPEGIASMANEAGWSVKRTWSDASEWFSVLLLET
jgi:dimethylhistidine N-methyltransferase